MVILNQTAKTSYGYFTYLKMQTADNPCYLIVVN